MKTVVQCDFDGTITEEDVSFWLLDAFADRDWRSLLKEYRDGKISVGVFNTKAFAMVKADRQTLIEFVRSKAKIRAGFQELITYCHKRGFEFVIVSNGLDFYIETILKDLGIKDVKVWAARTYFLPQGLVVEYIGPEGNRLEDGFKEASVNLFRQEGYWVIYVGNGLSDFIPARQAHYIFATGELLACCQEANLSCISFVDLNDVVSGLKLLRL